MKIENLVVSEMTPSFTPHVVLVAQSCPTLCDPMDCSPSGSSVDRISQARILAWLPFPSLRDLLDSGIKPRSPALQADSLRAEPPGKPHSHLYVSVLSTSHLIPRHLVLVRKTQLPLQEDIQDIPVMF